MIVKDLRSNTVGLVTAASAGTACDLADFGPCLLRVLPRVDVTQPFLAVERNCLANTSCQRVCLVSSSSSHSPIVAAQHRLHGRRDEHRVG